MFKHNALPSKHDCYHNFQRRYVDAFICVSRLVYNLQTDTLLASEKEKYYLIYNGINTKDLTSIKEKNLKVMVNIFLVTQGVLRRTRE